MIAFLRRRRELAALVRSHALLVDEALAAQRAGASRAEVALIVTGAHRLQLADSAVGLPTNVTIWGDPR